MKARDGFADEGAIRLPGKRDSGVARLDIYQAIGRRGLDNFREEGRAPGPERPRRVVISPIRSSKGDRQATGQEESGLEIRSLIKTKSPRIECHEYPARSEAHLRRLFALIREYLDAVDTGKFNFRPGWSCSMCDFRESHCRAWSP